MLFICLLHYLLGFSLVYLLYTWVGPLHVLMNLLLLIKKKNNCHFWLLQAHAASAVLNFSENCTPDILTPYLDVIVTKLLVLLQVYDHPRHHQPTLSMCLLVYVVLFDYGIQKCVYGTLNISTENVLGPFDFLSFFL
jgi:hypothetical protein